MAAAQQLEALRELGALQNAAHASEQEAWLLAAELQTQLAAAQKQAKQARAIASDSIHQVSSSTSNWSRLRTSQPDAPDQDFRCQ